MTLLYNLCWIYYRRAGLNLPCGFHHTVILLRLLYGHIVNNAVHPMNVIHEFCDQVFFGTARSLAAHCDDSLFC